MIRLIEYLITRRRLTLAHRTSPTINPETEPHQPRVGTGKSPMGRDGIAAWETK